MNSTVAELTVSQVMAFLNPVVHMPLKGFWWSVYVLLEINMHVFTPGGGGGGGLSRINGSIGMCGP